MKYVNQNGVGVDFQPWFDPEEGHHRFTSLHMYEELGGTLAFGSMELLHDGTEKALELVDKDDGTDDKGIPKWKKADPVEKDTASEEFPYAEDSICTSIIQEDFQVSIANTYSGFGGDPLGEMWNSQKPMAPYMLEIAKGLRTISRKTEEYQNKANAKGSSVWDKAMSGLSNILDKVASGQENMGKYLSRALVVQGTKFSYYGGTGIDFGNLQMKFTIFSQYIKEGNSYVFKSVNDQIEKILPYVIGEYVSVTELGDGEVGKFVQEFASWQMPPGNFAANLKNIDIIQQGTLKLRIGPYIAIENLVINGCQFEFSKALVKNPERGMSDKLLYPLSCAVTLTLKPITQYSLNSLKRFVFGEASKEYRKELADKIKTDHSSLESSDSTLFYNNYHV